MFSVSFIFDVKLFTCTVKLKMLVPLTFKKKDLHPKGFPETQIEYPLL